MYTDEQIIAAWYKVNEESPAPSLSALLKALRESKHASGADLLPHVPAIPRRDH